VDVLPGGPAAKAGLRATRYNEQTGRLVLGDVIVAINNEPVQSLDQLKAALKKHKIGDTVNVTVVRNGQKEQLKITLESAA
jgi:S1-C subfamily serine protease